VKSAAGRVVRAGAAHAAAPCAAREGVARSAARIRAPGATRALARLGRLVLVALVLVGLALVGLTLPGGVSARAEPPAPPLGAAPEPPPEEPEGADYEAEIADSLAEGSIEVDVGASGRAGSRPRQTRRVRFSDRTLGASVREGQNDPLAGGSVESGTRAARVGAGRLAPRWGRGLVLGAPADPWSGSPDDRGAGAPYRGRAGRGVWCRLGPSGDLESLCGSFARRDLAGVRARVRGLGLGALADRAGRAQGSLSLERGGAEHEVAFDRAGRWRAEAALRRAAGALAIRVRVRGGLAGFRSLAEPSRNGPAQALALELAGSSGSRRINALAALWRFGPGRTGARTALEVERGFLQHGSLAVGFEERHAPPRAPGRDPGFRQGAWGEWHGGAAGLALALRHEVLGAERLGRAAVRTVTAVRVDLEGPAGSALRVTHCAYRVRSGESLYLAEAASDRVVLRTVTGTGRRTRVEVMAPGAGGRIRAGLDVPVTPGARSSASSRPQWTLDWTRRARSR
jgi:hypothetical protein